MKREKNKISKLVMKKETLQDTVQKYKEIQETDMNSSMKTKWITWREWRDAQLSSVQFSSVQFSSVQFSRSVVSNSLRSHEWGMPGLLVHHQPLEFTDSCPSCLRCHPAISSSVIPFSSRPQSLPASGSFPVSQLFSWGGQSIGVSASASVLPMKTDLL